MKDLKRINDTLLDYYIKNEFKGFDPYDLKGSMILYNIQKYLGEVGYHLTDILNLNFPIILRKLLDIKSSENAKAYALFILGLVNLFKKTNDGRYLQIAKDLYSKVLILRNRSFNNLCFGYPFNWYNGYEIIKNTPNIVVTSFVGMAFISLYEITQDKSILKNCESIAQFILNDLNRYVDERGICFSYTIIDEKRVHNANLLGTQFLSNLSKYTGLYKDEIKNSFFFSINDMNSNCSWNYVDTKQIKKTTIDNYHTAFVLESLYEINKNEGLGKENFIFQGLSYYKKHLFEKGIPILSDYQKLPINIHSCASSIICLNKLSPLENSDSLMNQVLNYTLENLYDSKNDFFYYRINKDSSFKENNNVLKNSLFKLLIFKKVDKTRYMRWSDAWMFYALSEVICRTS